MTSKFWFIIACLLSYLIPSSLAARGYYIPITYKVNQKQTECIYDYFEKSDFVTYSTFVVDVMNNGPPMAKIQFEGPVAGNADVLARFDIADPKSENGAASSLGRELKTGTQQHWPKYKDIDKHTRYDKRAGIINRSLKVDWTHAGENEDAVAARAQIESERKEAYRNAGRGAPRSEVEEKDERFRTVTQVRIEPYEETNAIKAPGWYRLCVTSEMRALFVEMELRSGNRLGGVDRKTGHVYTYEERELLDEEKEFDEGIDAAEDSRLNSNTYKTEDEERQKEIENQVREQDLHATKAQVKHLNSMVGEMKKKHLEYNHRIKSHETTARRNYDNMVWSSKLETVMYVVITGVQVYTVRKWLLSNSLLGK